MAERFAQTRSFVSRDRLSTSGRVLVVLCVILAASAFPQFRPRFGGLSVHPYVAVLIVLLPIVIHDIGRVPRHILVLGGLFLALSGVALIGDVLLVSEMVKLGTAALTIFASALAIRSEKDFLAASFALIAAGCLIVVVEFANGNVAAGAETVVGVNFMEGVANKNAFSLYALPPILIGGYLFSFSRLRPVMRAFVALGTGALTLAIFVTANRSGWLGVFVIVGLLVAARFRVKTTIFAILILASVYLIATRTSAALMIEHRLDQTRVGYSSDDLRQMLIRESVAIGLENPAFGVGPSRLVVQLARRTPVNYPIVDPHNTPGYLLGAFGVPAALCFFALTIAICFICGFRPRHQMLNASQVLTRMIVVLFWARGMFSREILYAPAFAVMIGISIGLTLMRMQAIRLSNQSVAARGQKWPTWQVSGS